MDFIVAQAFKSEEKTLLNVNSNKKVTKQYLTVMKGNAWTFYNILSSQRKLNYYFFKMAEFINGAK